MKLIKYRINIRQINKNKSIDQDRSPNILILINNIILIIFNAYTSI